MGLILLILMIGVPIAEIAVFIEAGSMIGFWPTIGIIILTALLGTFFLRYQGMSVIAKAMDSLHNNQMPVRELVEGLGLLFAGALLLTPGFLTDAVGFLLLVPPFRQALAGSAIKYFMHSGRARTFSSRGGYQSAHWSTGGSTQGPTRQPPPAGGGPIIDGDYKEIDPDADKLPPNKPS